MSYELKDEPLPFACLSCGAAFDPISTRWLCPTCKYKASCCEGVPLVQEPPC